MKNIYVILISFFFIGNANAIEVIIHKTMLGSHVKGQNWNSAYRNETNVYDPFDNNVIVARIIDIVCEGTGDAVCPSMMIVPAGNNDSLNNPPLDNYLSLPAINGLQILLDDAVGRYESGQMDGYLSGTLFVTNSEQYYYTISWETISSQNKTDIKMTIAPTLGIPQE